MIMRPAVLLLFALLFSCVDAQDTLIYSNGDTIIGQVEEVGKESVRYRTSSAGNQVTITADKMELERLTLASGQAFLFNDGSFGKRSAGYKERVDLISVDFIAPALGHFTIGYEKLLQPRMSLAIKAGYIGLGLYSPNSNTYGQQGALLKAGVNFILPSARRRGSSTREQHPLDGWHLRPEIIANCWDEERSVYDYTGSTYRTVRDTRANVCFNVVIGRKLILGERFSFELYGGLGYGMQWLNGIRTEEQSGHSSGPYYSGRVQYAYSHSFFGERTPLIGSGGMMFGYLF